MNFLLFFFIIFSNCTSKTYTITYRTNKNYEVLQNLIQNTSGEDLIRLFDEIRNKLNFNCTFTLDNYIDTKEITISQLNNKDARTGYCIIPRLFCEITCIKRLIISSLRLATLPIEFRNLTELKYLDLSNNEFEIIPESLFSLTKLKVLHFNNNIINAIPSEIIKTRRLNTLYIGGYGNLKRVNINLFKLKTLRELNLSESKLLFSTNNLVEYPTTTFEKNDNNLLIEDYKYLKSPIISHNDLDRIPSFFTNFINLEELDISQNTFNKIPEEIHLFSSLKILNISKNYITEFIIGNDLFSNLLILDLSYNEITKISISTSSLQKSETLNLNSNEISILTKDVFQLNQLKKLSLNSNTPLTEIEKYSYTSDNPIILELTISDISVLPNIFYYNTISELIVRANRQFNDNIDIFEHVPIDSQIRSLDLSKCYLTYIPNNISRLTNLEVFIAQNNIIIEITNVFRSTLPLKLLDLSVNGITTIDEGIFDIITLEELILVNNHIEFLPPRINTVKNTNLKIDLSKNPIRPETDPYRPDSEMISIEEVNSDILKNKKYKTVRPRGYTRGTRFYNHSTLINSNLDIKEFYTRLNIPNNERLNLDKIKLCNLCKPQKYTMKKILIEKMLQNIFQHVSLYNEEEILSYLIELTSACYSHVTNHQPLDSKPVIKQYSMLDYIESIVMMMTYLLPKHIEYLNDSIAPFADLLSSSAGVHASHKGSEECPTWMVLLYPKYIELYLILKFATGIKILRTI